MPTSSDEHVNSLLGTFSVAFIQDAKNFAFNRAFSHLPVKHKSDVYSVYSIADFMRDEAKERAPGKETAGGDYSIDNTPSYLCRTYGFHKDVSEEEMDNAEEQMDPKRVATEFVTQKMLIKQERIWASKYMTAVWGNNLTGVSGTPSTNEFKQWDASSGVTILKNVGTWREQIASVTGNEPNKMVIAPDVFEVLTQAQEIKDTIQYSSGGVVTEDLLARLFRVEEVIVPRGIVNTANAGATAALQRIVAKKVLFCYAPKKVTTMTPTAGITFNWTGRKGSSKFGTRIKDYYIEPLDSHRVEGEVRVDFKQVASACGVYAAAVIA